MRTSGRLRENKNKLGLVWDKNKLALVWGFIKIQNQLQVPLRESVGFFDSDLQKAMHSVSQPAIKAVQNSMEKVDREIKELIASDLDLQTQFKRVTSVQGIGPVTAAHVIVATNEFNRITDPKKFACFAGVAPFQYTSGTSIRGKSKVSNIANMQMKKLLFMAAMSAIQNCEELKAYYLRKTSEGKKNMSVINAVRNKLIARIFACVRDQRNYEKIYKHALA
jgi:transposase